MHHQSRGFVDHQYVAIFVNQAQCNRLRQYLGLRRLVQRHLHTDARSRLDDIPRFAGHPVHLDRTAPRSNP